MSSAAQNRPQRTNAAANATRGSIALKCIRTAAPNAKALAGDPICFFGRRSRAGGIGGSGARADARSRARTAIGARIANDVDTSFEVRVILNDDARGLNVTHQTPFLADGNLLGSFHVTLHLTLDNHF